MSTSLNLKNYFCPLIAKDPGLNPTVFRHPGKGEFVPYTLAPRTSTDAKDRIAIGNTELSKAHTIARVAGVVLGIIALLGLAALEIIAIYFPAVVLPFPVLPASMILAGYLAVAVLLPVISKIAMQNEVVHAPNDPYPRYELLEPIRPKITVCYKDGPRNTVVRLADKDQTDRNNQTISTYRREYLTIATGHTLARVTAVTLLALTILAAIALPVVHFAYPVVALPFSLVEGYSILGGVALLALSIHLLSKHRLKDEYIRLPKENFQENDKMNPNGAPRIRDLYKQSTQINNDTDWSHYPDGVVIVKMTDEGEIAGYKTADQYTEAFHNRNCLNDANQPKLRDLGASK